jgi:hypothetical protein
MLSTGDIIDGKYRIIRLLGEGGMGAVYEGENMRIHRKVAIKVLHSAVAATGEAVARFEREAQAAGRIGSEHIVEVLDLGNLPSGDRYMVMEFMDGDALSTRIRARTRLTAGEIYPIMHQLLEALAAAHGAGIIHRDLKPDNVYLLKSRGGKADFVKLLDFGISKFNQLSGDSGFSMTRTGAVMGTPYYMAPEQAKGSRELDHRVDLYAAGVILYEAITGEVPFNADTFNELLFKIVLEAAKPVEQVVPNLDPGFAAIVNKSMGREPATRFQTAREFQQALEQWASGAGPQLVAQLAAPAQYGPPPMQHQPIGTGQYAAAPAGHQPMGTGQYAAAGAPQQHQPLGTGPYPAAAAHALGTGTPGSWANTGGYNAPEVPKKSSAGLFIGLSFVGVLLLGGGAFVAMSLSHGKDEAAAAAGKAETEKADAEKAKAEQGEKAAQDAAAKSAAEAEKAKAETEAMKAEADKAKAGEAAAKIAATPPAPVARTGGSRPATTPKPEAKPATPAPAPAPAPAAAPATTGRRIRTTL